ncbi:MAG: hypothetical protein U9R79_08310 [Armatimonadota bacterium]|nr:hypothetical protein [Armatimonadota bacterium]
MLRRGHAAILAGLLAATVAGVPSSARAQNLLRNGSFEGPVAGTVPESWSFHDFQGDELASGEVDRGGRVGPHCLKLTSPVFPVDYVAYCRPIDVEDLDSDELIFSCFFRTKDHPQAQVTLATYGEDFTEREFATPDLLTESHPLGETRRWVLYTTHLQLRPGTKQLVVMLRVMGEGTVYWDGASVREVGGQVEAELQEAGTLVDLPGRRIVQCRVRNATERELPLRLELEASDEKHRPRRRATPCTLVPGQRESLQVVYPFDFRQPHRLFVAVVGDSPDEVHEAWRLQVPGLVDARIVEPAFRSMVLSTVPTEQIVVQGELNALAEIARRAEISGHLVGTGARAEQPELLSDEGLTGPWLVRLSTEGMLTEEYEVAVTARVDNHEHTLSLPLQRAPRAEAEVAYDARHRLWVNGQQTFPLGIYRVVEETDLPRISEAGFNFTITPSRSVSWRYANAARDEGLHVAIGSPTLQGLFWTNITETYSGREALLGWYGLELPDAQAATTQVLEQAYVRSTEGPYKAIAQLDPHHPVILALRPNGTMDEFARVADIVLAWSEPLPKWSITMVSEAVRRAHEAVDGRKPVWAVIQSTGHLWTTDPRPGPEDLTRPPTPAEHRAMVYLALMEGAEGLAYYAYSLPSVGERPSYRMEADAPELWESIQETNRQVLSLEPVLLAADPAPLDLGEGPIRAAQWEHEGSRYVIAVNADEAATAAVLDIGAEPGEEIDVLFEQRTTIATDSGAVGEAFEPYGVHVYMLSG